MLHYYCKIVTAFFNDQSEAVRLLNQVTVDLTKMCVFLAFKSDKYCTNMTTGFAPRHPNKVLGTKSSNGCLNITELEQLTT